MSMNDAAEELTTEDARVIAIAAGRGGVPAAQAQSSVFARELVALTRLDERAALSARYTAGSTPFCPTCGREPEPPAAA